MNLMPRLLQTLWMVTMGCLAGALHAEDPTKVDPATVNRWSGQPAPLQASPTPLKQAEGWTGEVRTPDSLEMARSVLQDRRAPIDLSEARAKEVRRNELLPAAVVRGVAAEAHDWSSQRATWQTSQRFGDDKPQLVERYQSRMRDASRAADRSSELLLNRDGFAGLNRFIFRRNRADNSPKGTIAAGAGANRP
jgi:hypothetical protein